jgi:hypothetical protein
LGLILDPHTVTSRHSCPMRHCALIYVLKSKNSCLFWMSSGLWDSAKFIDSHDKNVTHVWFDICTIRCRSCFGYLVTVCSLSYQTIGNLARMKTGSCTTSISRVVRVCGSIPAIQQQSMIFYTPALHLHQLASSVHLNRLSAETSLKENALGCWMLVPVELQMLLAHAASQAPWSTSLNAVIIERQLDVCARRSAFRNSVFPEQVLTSQLLKKHSPPVHHHRRLPTHC